MDGDHNTETKVTDREETKPGGHSHVGSSFEDWLKEEGLFEECDAEANRRVGEYRNAVRESMGRILGELFTRWGLTPQEQVALLGLVDVIWTTGTPLPDAPGVQERAGHLLHIHENLQVIFPDNPDLVYRWMSIPNQRFGGLRPVDFAQDQGEDGLMTLRRYLDFERSR